MCVCVCAYIFLSLWIQLSCKFRKFNLIFLTYSFGRTFIIILLLIIQSSLHCPDVIVTNWPRTLALTWISFCAMHLTCQRGWNSNHIVCTLYYYLNIQHLVRQCSGWNFPEVSEAKRKHSLRLTFKYICFNLVVKGFLSISIMSYHEFQTTVPIYIQRF